MPRAIRTCRSGRSTSEPVRRETEPDADVMTNRVTIVEVGPRDGLQNEAARIATADKVAFVERLAAAGLPVVEVTSFVRPDRVPQLADAREVFAALAGAGRRAGTVRDALHGPGPEPHRPARGGGGRRARGRDLRGGLRGVQPAQHQPLDRAVAGVVRGGLRRGARRRGARPRLPVHGVRVPVRRRRRSAAGGGARAAAGRSRRLRGGDQRHDRHRASGPGAGRRRGRARRMASASTSSRCTSTTRAARRWPT